MSNSISFVGSLGEADEDNSSSSQVDSEQQRYKQMPVDMLSLSLTCSSNLPGSLFALDVHDDEDDIDNLC